MDPDTFKHLLRRYLSGEATDEEIALLRKWYDSFDDSSVELPLEPGEEADMLEQRLLSRLNTVVHPSPVITMRKRHFWRYAAAVLALPLAAAVWWMLPKKDHSPISTPVVVAQQITPGGNKAVLTLGDGSIITLDSLGKGTLAQQGAVQIIQASDGLSYEGRSNNVLQYNIIQVPKGGQFMITLQDGSKIWLNAASSLRYPAAFTSGERQVELRGEAFFDVAQDAARPFVVKVIKDNEVMDVRVLGTSFNIMAYQNESDITTTLLSGAVKLQQENNSVLIRPGEQANGLKVSKGDVELATAWKNGYFQFDRNNIETIMRQIARWYDIDVEFKGSITARDFAGTIPRNKNIAEVLKILELTGLVKCTVEGRKVTVASL